MFSRSSQLTPLFSGLSSVNPLFSGSTFIFFDTFRPQPTYREKQRSLTKTEQISPKTSRINEPEELQIEEKPSKSMNYRN